MSNLRLASGLGPVRALLDGGVDVSLGSDGCGSCTTSRMLDVVGAAAMLHTLRGEMGAWIGAREAALLAAAREIHTRLLPDFARSDALVDGIRPVYERIYRRCQAKPIPGDTYPARF